MTPEQEKVNLLGVILSHTDYEMIDSVMLEFVENDPYLHLEEEGYHIAPLNLIPESTTVGRFGKQLWQNLRWNATDRLIELYLQEPDKGTALINYLHQIAEEMEEKVVPLWKETMKEQGIDGELQDNDYWRYVQESEMAMKTAVQILMSQLPYSN